MKRIFSLGALGGAALLIAGCAGPAAQETPVEPGAAAELQARSGSRVGGTVLFSQLADGRLRVEVQGSGLAAGEHGFHVHEAGDCSAADASSAKGHYNPARRMHGHPSQSERHAGDLTNLVGEVDGSIKYVAEIRGVTLAEVIGRSVVVHADPDDYVSQPAGNSGKRIACGVIVAR